MKTASCKSKGRELQKYVAKTVAEAFGLHSDDVVSRPMGSGGTDIMMSPLAQKLFPVSIECKNTKTKPGPDALEQANYNCYNDTYPAVAWKPPRKGMNDTLIIMQLSDLISLIQQIRIKENRIV